MWILCLLFSLVSAKGIVVSIILLIFLFEFTGVNCSAEPLIPSTGFIRANVDDGEPEIIRVLRQIPRNPICKTISFVNIPEPNASPLMGPNEFRMVTDGVYNGHFAWSNGPEFISFVNSAGPPSKGNWLLGNRAGMDSGYVYITTQSNGDLTPLHQESSTNTWKWLQKSQWVDFPDLYMICMDEMLLPSVYYEVEHYHNSHAPVQSYLIPNMNTFLDPTTSSFFHLRDFHLGLLQTALLISLQKDSMTTALITNVENITTFGALSLLSPTTATTAATTQAKETKNSKKNSISTTSTTPKPSNQYGILVNIEHIDLGWHLTYREITFTSTKYTSFFTNTIQTSTAATGAGGDSEVIFTQNMTQTIQQNLDTKELSLHVFTHNRIQRTMNSVSKTSSSSSTTDKSTDSTVPYQITPLSSAKRQAYYDYWMSMLERVQVGDYLWVWYSPKLRSSSSTTGSSTSSGMRYGDDDNVPQDDVTEIEIEELILQCVGMNTTHVFFHLHPTHRMDVMQSTLLHTLTTVITIPITNLITSLPHQAHGLPAYYGTTKIVIHSGLLLPKHQILTFLWKYIHYKETELNGLSSCYMYHAAVSMPQVFVYANELLCLLLGSKPVVMVSPLSLSLLCIVLILIYLYFYLFLLSCIV